MAHLRADSPPPARPADPPGVCAVLARAAVAAAATAATAPTCWPIGRLQTPADSGALLGVHVRLKLADSEHRSVGSD